MCTQKIDKDTNVGYFFYSQARYHSLLDIFTNSIVCALSRFTVHFTELQYLIKTVLRAITVQ